MHVLSRIISTVLGIILITILPFVIFTYVTSKSPVLFDFRSFIVLTGSMEPTLPVGSVVYTQPKPAYEKGDIITFKNSESKTVTHRIVKKSGDGKETVYATKGDANKSADHEQVAYSSIIGAEFLNVPYIGKYSEFLKKPQHFILIVIIPAIVFIAIELWRIRTEIVKDTEKRVLKRLEEQKQV